MEKIDYSAERCFSVFAPSRKEPFFERHEKTLGECWDFIIENNLHTYEIVESFVLYRVIES